MLIYKTRKWCFGKILWFDWGIQKYAYTNVNKELSWAFQTAAIFVLKMGFVRDVATTKNMTAVQACHMP